MSERSERLFSVPPLTGMFYFSGCAPPPYGGAIAVYAIGFPHSEISGSSVAQHLTGAYRSYATSFIAT